MGTTLDAVPGLLTVVASLAVEHRLEGVWTSVAVLRGLSICDWQAQWCSAHWFSCPEACGVLVPKPGIEPMSPALTGKFFF